MLISLVVRRETSTPPPRSSSPNCFRRDTPRAAASQPPIGTGARAVVSCGQNADPGGPTSSTFTLAEDDMALQCTSCRTLHPQTGGLLGVAPY
jgi:hypothetical protein